MDDAKRKRLILFLGEYVPDDAVERAYWKTPRTFDIWSDLGAVKEKLVEKGMWGEFIDFAFEIWCKKENYAFENWLFEPARFCELAAEFLEKEE